MATEEHKRLATIIKDVHENLRKSAKEIGAEEAWSEHLQKQNVLKVYAEAMQNLAGVWEANASSSNSNAKSRINWIVDYCFLYFFTDKIFLEKRRKETKMLLLENINISVKHNEVKIVDKINLLDVGSCFNPFAKVDAFEVTAIDISPAVESVYKCDFLKVNIGENYEYSNSNDKELATLPGNYFHCVVFSLLLEYLPTSEQRVNCCKKAYDLLQHEGILIIVTPDSQHVGKNAKLMKNWRFTLAHLGFSRIKFEKLPHITCLVFRKCLEKTVSQKWAEAHKEAYMDLSLHTPQDFSHDKEQK